LHLGGSWNPGLPKKTLYPFKLLISLTEREEKKFHFAQDFYWYNAAKLPSPAEWVNVRRIRVKDAVDYIWWLSKSENPKADNAKVLKAYSKSMLNLLKNGYQAKLRPSGHDISEKFSRKHAGAIHPNFLVFSNTDSNSRYLRMCREEGVKVHPARWPEEIPQFFMQFLTDVGDKVLEPFGGSNVTGAVAERLGRRWMCFEIVEEYLKGSTFHFEEDQLLSHK
jgi:site-specific DNA-methyltransferase (cytosine-N4-specific)